MCIYNIDMIRIELIYKEEYCGYDMEIYKFVGNISYNRFLNIIKLYDYYLGGDNVNDSFKKLQSKNMTIIMHDEERDSGTFRETFIFNAQIYKHKNINPATYHGCIKSTLMKLIYESFSSNMELSSFSYDGYRFLPFDMLDDEKSLSKLMSTDNILFINHNQLCKIYDIMLHTENYKLMLDCITIVNYNIINNDNLQNDEILNDIIQIWKNKCNDVEDYITGVNYYKYITDITNDYDIIERISYLKDIYETSALVKLFIIFL